MQVAQGLNESHTQRRAEQSSEEPVIRKVLQ